MTQNLEILRYLQAGHSLTALEALDKFKCMRLAAVINALRRQGYDIETRTVHTLEGKHYARYHMKRPGETW